MNIGELRDQYIGNVVVFKKGVDDLEAYPEEGMKARVIDLRVEHDGEVIKMRVDYSEFDQFNLNLESSNYYDDDGIPRHTCREAGLYSKQETLYLDGTGDWNWTDVFTIAAGVLEYMEYDKVSEMYKPMDGYIIRHKDVDVVAVKQYGADRHHVYLAKGVDVDTTLTLKSLSVFKLTQVI